MGSISPVMNWLDVVISSFLGLGLIYGLSVGLGGALVSILSLLAGYALAGRFYVKLAAHLAPYLKSLPVAQFSSFLLIMLAVLVGFRLVHMVGKRLFGTSGMTFRNRLLGGLLGIVLGVILSSAALVMIMVISPGSEETIASSRLGAHFSRASRFTISYFPPHLIEELDQKLDRILEERWGEGLEGLRDEKLHSDGKPDDNP